MTKTPLLALIALLCALLFAGCSGDSGDGDKDMQMDMTVDQTEDADTVEDTEDVEDTDDAEDVEDTTDATDTTDTTDATDTEDIVECDPACGDNATCSDGVCECDAGFGDCDSDMGNGCEASLDQPDTCGTCDPGANCDVANISGVCTVDTPGETGYCELDCATGYVDLDGDTGTETPTNGCETGFTDENAEDLSGDLPGDIIEMVKDGDTIYALMDTGTLQIAPIDVSGATPVVGTVLDTGNSPGGTTHIAASNGIVAVNGGPGNALVVYENVGGTITQARLQGFVAGDVAAVPTPLTTNATAEFIAVGAGTRWYGVYPQGMEPTMGVTCNDGDAGTTVAVCELDSVGAFPANGTVAVVEDFAGSLYAIGAGDATSELLIQTMPASLSNRTAGGDNIDSGAADVIVGPADTLWAAEGTSLASYEYTLDMQTMEPESRTRSVVADLMPATTTSVAVLDDARALVGTDGGATVVAVASGNSAAVPGPMNAVGDVLVDGSTVYIAEGTTLWTFTADLNAF